MTDKTPKRDRVRLARSEILAFLGITCQRWDEELRGTEPGVLPFDQWPADEPMVVLCRTYKLTPADLAHICADLGDSLIYRATNCGYDERWDDPQPPHRSTIGTDDMRPA